VKSRSRVLVGVALAAMLAPFAFLSRMPPGAAADPAVGDPTRGATLFRQCAACHSVEPGLHLTGPSLAAIWGRRSGAVGGFGRYSAALKRADITWDAETLDRWLARPEAVVPDTSMTFQGVANARQRADLIAYLKAVAEGKAPPAPAGGMMGAGPRSDLKRAGKDRRVTAIRHCGDAYHVTTEAGRTIPFWEFNLRFKTDSSPLGPKPRTPVLAPQGMQGDRAQVVFSGLDDLKRFIIERCEADER
jgi:cytochrome c